MADYRFQREARSFSSEVYNIMDGDRIVGRIDVHFTPSHVHGTLTVIESMTTEDIEELIELVDDDIVNSADSERPDFIVTVYQGRFLGTYTDEDFMDSDVNSENGH